MWVEWDVTIPIMLSRAGIVWGVEHMPAGIMSLVRNTLSRLSQRKGGLLIHLNNIWPFSWQLDKLTRATSLLSVSDLFEMRWSESVSLSFFSLLEAIVFMFSNHQFSPRYAFIIVISNWNHFFLWKYFLLINHINNFTDRR